jgi:hypothetical protein
VKSGTNSKWTKVLGFIDVDFVKSEEIIVSKNTPARLKIETVNVVVVCYHFQLCSMVRYGLLRQLIDLGSPRGSLVPFL